MYSYGVSVYCEAMKTFTMLSAMLAVIATVPASFADEATASADAQQVPYVIPTYPPLQHTVYVAPEPVNDVPFIVRHRWLGVQMDVGVPDGASIGLVVRPFNWLRTELAFTDNYIAPGARLGVTFDPIRFPIALTETVEAGFETMGSIPGHKTDLPSAGYNYVNLHLGLEFGNRDKWRIFLHAGPSYVHVATENFQSIAGSGASSLVLGNPTADLWILPTAKLGFAVYF